MAFASSSGNTIATLPPRQSQQKLIAQHPTGIPASSMGSVEENYDTDTLVIRAFLSKVSEVEDLAAQIEHKQASFLAETLSLECRIRVLEEDCFASTSTLGKRSRSSCEALAVGTPTEKLGQAVGRPFDQYHTHIAGNTAHVPLTVTAAELNTKESPETLLHPSPHLKSSRQGNYVDYPKPAEQSPSTANGQLMQTPQQTINTPLLHDIPISIDVVPEPGANECLGGANVNLERVWNIDSTNPSEAGSDPELELQYPSDADLELEHERSRMGPNVPTSELNICCPGCKRTFSCQGDLTRHLKSEGNSECKKVAETESAEAASAYLMASISEIHNQEEAMSMKNTWGTPPTASIADGEIVFPVQLADTGTYTQPATPSIKNNLSLDVDSHGSETEASGIWDATNHFERRLDTQTVPYL